MKFNISYDVVWVLAELDANNGIGLVEKKKRGLGKPDLIYVKNFSTISNSAEDNGKKPGNTDKYTEVGKN